MPLREFISTRQVFAAIAMVVYASTATRQPELVTTIFWASALMAAVLFILPDWMIPIRIVVTTMVYFAFILGRIETRRIVMASAVAVWLIASAYFAARLQKLGRKVGASIVGVISDMWLIAMLTLLTLEGYIVTGLLLISAASWIPRTRWIKPWLAVAFALFGGWLIIAAQVDFDLELRRWYLLGALAIGIGGSLLTSAQEVQQREDVHPE